MARAYGAEQGMHSVEPMVSTCYTHSLHYTVRAPHTQWNLSHSKTKMNHSGLLAVVRNDYIVFHASQHKGHQHKKEKIFRVSRQSLNKKHILTVLWSEFEWLCYVFSILWCDVCNVFSPIDDWNGFYELYSLESVKCPRYVRSAYATLSVLLLLTLLDYSPRKSYISLILRSQQKLSRLFFWLLMLRCLSILYTLHFISLLRPFAFSPLIQSSTLSIPLPPPLSLSLSLSVSFLHISHSDFLVGFPPFLFSFCPRAIHTLYHTAPHHSSLIY